MRSTRQKKENKAERPKKLASESSVKSAKKRQRVVVRVVATTMEERNRALGAKFEELVAADKSALWRTHVRSVARQIPGLSEAIEAYVGRDEIPLSVVNGVLKSTVEFITVMMRPGEGETIETRVEEANKSAGTEFSVADLRLFTNNVIRCRGVNGQLCDNKPKARGAWLCRLHLHPKPNETTL